MTPTGAEVRRELEAALSEVSAAEGSLEGLLRDMHAAPRAEKITVTTVVGTAVARLRNARVELAKLHALVDE